MFDKSKGYEDLPVTLPCGQCKGCRLEKSRQWAIRCHHEASLSNQNSFVTLTYNDEHLPLDGSLNRRHLQLFMKRLRKEFGAGIRFYACGEYGDLRRRPHYHLCLFNFDPPDRRKFSNDKKSGNIYYSSKILDDIWGKGFTITGDVSFQSAAYVARYIMKKITGDRAEAHYKNAYSHVDPTNGETYNISFNLAPEFNAMSLRPGIGAEWLKKFNTDVYPDDFIVINGKKVRPPRFYDNHFEVEYPSEYKKIRAKRVRNSKKHADNNTPERLRVRETVLEAKLKRLPRTLEEY